MKSQTLGERRVRVTFNPSQDDAVYRHKITVAGLIDEMEALKALATGNRNPEQARLCAMAQSALEEAAMWAVKALTAET